MPRGVWYLGRMDDTRWNRKDGKGKLSIARQKEYERAGITESMYQKGYRLYYSIVPPRGDNDVAKWPRDSLETTVQLQWKVIRTLERKLEHAK
jgi:hypothetical protein